MGALEILFIIIIIIIIIIKPTVSVDVKQHFNNRRNTYAN